MAETHVLVIKPEGVYFDMAFKGLEERCEDEFKCIPIEFATITNEKKWFSLIEEYNPKVLILMGNSVINQFIELKKSSSKELPPAIFIMAVFVDKIMDNVDNSIGIRYEIPAVNSLVHFRSVYNGNFKKVGVIFREGLREYIEQQKAMCALESIELIPKEIPNQRWNLSTKLQKALNQLILDDNVDALWVINDSTLLTANLIVRAWQPAVRKYKKPVIVGVDNLTRTRLKFGLFAVQPDHYALGSQAGDMLFELSENNFKIDRQEVQGPLSVYKTLNLYFGKDKLGLEFHNLGEVDLVEND